MHSKGHVAGTCSRDMSQGKDYDLCTLMKMLLGHVPSCKTTAVIARVSKKRITLYWSLLCGKKLAALVDELIEEHQLVDSYRLNRPDFVDVSQTRMVISHFKENAIFREKNLKDNGNKVKTKKAMAPVRARIGNTQPPRGVKEIKSRWHSMRFAQISVFAAGACCATKRTMIMPG